MESLIYFLLIAALFVFMMRFGCGAHVMGHGHRHGRSGGPDTDSSETQRWNAPARDKDPVCGMTVDTASAKPSVHQGKAYYFCSTDCRDKFEAAPERYAGSSDKTAQFKETEHGTHH